MFFYDLSINAWVRKPGSNSPPEMTPVMCIGAIFDFPVTFCAGVATENPIATAWIGGIKLEGDATGEYVASDSAPEVDGAEMMRFVFDLTTGTDPAALYFAANPTAETVAAVVQIGFTDAYSNVRRTQPLRIVLQKDYLSTS